MRNSFYLVLLATLASDVLAQPIKSFPYSLSATREITITVAGLACQGAGILINKDKDNRQFDFSDAQENNIPFFDRWSVSYNSEDAATSSDVTELGGIAFPLLITGNTFIQDKKQGLIVLTMYAQTMLITTGMINTTKGIVNRYRPYVYSNNFPDDKNDAYAAKSFFSGHTAATAASAFFAAKVLSDMSRSTAGWKNAAWITAATIPAVTGALRIGAGRHFLSDVVAGYAVGAAMGILIPHLHKAKKSGGGQTQIIPLYNKNVKGISVVYWFDK